MQFLKGGTLLYSIRCGKILHSRVAEGMRIIGGGGLEMARYNNNRGGRWNNRGLLVEIGNGRFLRQTRIFYIFM